MYRISDMLFDLKEWIIFHKTAFFSSLVGFFVVLFVGIGMYNRVPAGEDKDGNPVADSNEQIETMDTYSKDLQKKYNVLSFDTGANQHALAIEVNLFMKQPFIDEDTIRRDMRKYIQLLKDKYNDKQKKTWVQGVQIHLFDRKIVFDRKLADRGTFYYMLDNGYVLDETKKNSDGDTMDTSGMSTLNFVWMHTTTDDKRIKKQPDYEHYTLTSNTIQTVDLNSNVKALSDEEFALYLKLNMYSVLTGSNIGAVRLYLRWDLGLNLNKSGMQTIVDEFVDFMNRQEKISPKMVYYTNEDLLKQKLAVQRPQFLAFALYDEIISSRTEAQKYLIKMNSDLFMQVIKDDIDKRSEAINRDGTSSYKAGTDFDATIGVNAKKHKTNNSLELRQDGETKAKLEEGLGTEEKAANSLHKAVEEEAKKAEENN